MPYENSRIIDTKSDNATLLNAKWGEDSLESFGVVTFEQEASVTFAR